ncbi:MAG: ACP S-malonyltransferase [Atopostipes suicloacalis]|nr:ACP S-malonyltransferase [Atopostipes suicloacalis]MDN6731331.1 ACP S-malonyltransferase [Atopostipes suicloacalis]
MSLAIIFNGQGAHYQGMGQDFSEQFPEAKSVFEEAERLTNKPIREIINQEPEKLEETLYAQVAIVATSLAIYQSIEQELSAINFMAGLSLGEYTALIANKNITFEEGFKILKERGKLMAEHCQRLRESSDLVMEVVLSVPLEEVKSIIDEVNKEKEELFLANINSSKQFILAGTKKSVEYFKQLAKAKGYRKMMPLKVEGPFHSPYMEALCDPYANILEGVSFYEGENPVISNTTVEVHKPDQIKEKLVRHLVEPVRWQETIQYMMDSGVTKIIQIGPGKTLVNLLKRESQAPKTLLIDQVEDIAKIKEFIGG